MKQDYSFVEEHLIQSTPSTPPSEILENLSDTTITNCSDDENYEDEFLDYMKSIGKGERLTTVQERLASLSLMQEIQSIVDSVPKQKSEASSTAPTTPTNHDYYHY